MSTQSDNGPTEQLTITHVPYDPAWPGLFEREATRIRDILGDTALLIEHAGSTSVPGLMAKPIIDMVLVVPDTTDEDAYVPALTAAGYRMTLREPDWYEHRMLKGPDTNINLHTFSAGCEEIGRMLAFRDWLRSHDEDRDRYQDVKRQLGTRTWRHIDDYSDAKTTVIGEILRRMADAAS